MAYQRGGAAGVECSVNSISLGNTLNTLKIILVFISYYFVGVFGSLFSIYAFISEIKWMWMNS